MFKYIYIYLLQNSKLLVFHALHKIHNITIQCKNMNYLTAQREEYNL